MFSYRKPAAALIGVSLAVLGAERATALTALEGVSGGSPYDAYYSGSLGDTVGWSFSIDAPITVTALGIWDDGDIVAPHIVGIWSGGSLLVSQEVDATEGTLSGGFYFESVAPLELAAGTYSIGALYVDDDGDSYTSGVTSATYAPEITWLSSLYPSAADLGFAEPTIVSGSSGRFGPNFQFTTSAVPLPGAAALLAGGLAAFGALGAARRRRG